MVSSALYSRNHSSANDRLLFSVTELLANFMWSITYVSRQRPSDRIEFQVGSCRPHVPRFSDRAQVEALFNIFAKPRRFLSSRTCRKAASRDARVQLPTRAESRRAFMKLAQPNANARCRRNHRTAAGHAELLLVRRQSACDSFFARAGFIRWKPFCPNFRCAALIRHFRRHARRDHRSMDRTISPPISSMARTLQRTRTSSPQFFNRISASAFRRSSFVHQTLRFALFARKMIEVIV